MILPLIEGTRCEQWEVDLWVYMSEDVGEVVLETVCASKEAALRLIDGLQAALKDVRIIKEGTP